MTNDIDNDRDPEGRSGGTLSAMFAPFIAAWSDMPSFVRQFLTANPIEFDSFTVTIAENDVPIQLLGRDLSRTRALVRASRTDVFVGTMAQLGGGGLGYPLPQGGSDELKATEAIYVVCRTDTPTGAPARIGVFSERQGRL